MSVSLAAAVDAVRARLAAVAAQPTPAGSDAAMTLLAQLGQAAVLADVVAALRADPAETARMAADSYRHVLGFDKLVLLRAPRNEAQLRLHVWWPGDARVNEDVHNHRFAFSSAIVVGRLRTRLHAVDPDGAPHVEYREAAAEAERAWRFAPVGEVRLRPVCHLEFAAGSRYTLTTTALHQVDVPPDELAVSLLLQTAVVRPWSGVYRPAGAAPPPDRAQPRRGRAEFDELLGRVVTELRAAGRTGDR